MKRDVRKRGGGIRVVVIGQAVNRNGVGYLGHGLREGY
jgi:hypothetical protein